MTAVNVVIGADRVSLFTDAAAVNFAGQMRRLVSKTRSLPDMKCAIATRGLAGALSAFASILPTLAHDYDGLFQAARNGDLVRACSRLRSISTGRLSLVANFDLVVTGIGHRGPAAFMICNHNHHPGVKAWKAFKIPSVLIMPPVTLPERIRNNPGAFMAVILDRQREHLEPTLLIPRGRSIVGGFAECTTVTADQITTSKVLEWPDRIGRPIGGNQAAPRAAWGRLKISFAVMGGLWLLGFTLWQGPALVYVARTYEGLPASFIETESGRFEIEDRPDLDRVVTVGVAKGAAHASAASAWLTSRGCSIVSSAALLPSEWEHLYKCSSSHVAR